MNQLRQWKLDRYIQGRASFLWKVDLFMPTFVIWHLKILLKGPNKYQATVIIFWHHYLVNLAICNVCTVYMYAGVPRNDSWGEIWVRFETNLSQLVVRVSLCDRLPLNPFNEEFELFKHSFRLFILWLQMIPSMLWVVLLDQVIRKLKNK